LAEGKHLKSNTLWALSAQARAPARKPEYQTPLPRSLRPCLRGPFSASVGRRPASPSTALPPWTARARSAPCRTPVRETRACRKLLHLTPLDPEASRNLPHGHAAPQRRQNRPPPIVRQYPRGPPGRLFPRCPRPQPRQRHREYRDPAVNRRAGVKIRIETDQLPARVPNLGKRRDRLGRAVRDGCSNRRSPTAQRRRSGPNVTSPTRSRITKDSRPSSPALV
jgi:hypothetical protein